MLDFAPQIVASVLIALASGVAPAVEDTQWQRVQLAQVTIEQRVMIRITPIQPPARPGQRGAALTAPLPDPPQAPSFKETKGPKCLKLDTIRGAVINSGSGVTMMTDRDELYRTHFGRSCRAADFYAGFYIEPNKDGSVCAGRDTLRARTGSTCEIEKFSKLVPDD